jgi:hypothetical protein
MVDLTVAFSVCRIALRPLGLARIAYQERLLTPNFYA